MMNDKDKMDFKSGMISFYVNLFKGVSDAVKILAALQDNYKDEYKNIKEIQTEPTKIYELMDKLKDEDRRILLDLLLRANILQVKFMRIFELTPKQQITLSGEIDTFIDEFKKFVAGKNDKN